MTTTGGDGLFVDTNVWVHASVPDAPMHAEAAQALAGSATPLWTSRQILREFLAVMSRPQTFFAGNAPMPELVARAGVIAARCRVAEDGPGVTARVFDLLTKRETRGKQLHDANVVATMLAHGLSTLLTHNVSDFERWRDLIDVQPLG